MRIHNNVMPQPVQTEAAAHPVPLGSPLRFQDVLDSKITEKQNAGLQFSKHAFMRLNARNIQLSTDQLQRVQNGVNEAKQKGIQDSLVLVDDVALVVNVRSKTVITAMNPEQNIFTNIDGAVIV